MNTKAERTTEDKAQNQTKRPFWKTIVLWLIAIILILFGLLAGLFMPCGGKLTCEKASKTCQISYRYSLRTPRVVKFSFSDVVGVHSKFMHSRRSGKVYGLQIVLKQGGEVIDEVRNADAVAETVNAYLRNPQTASLEFDPHSDLMDILGMVALLFGGFCGVLKALGKIPKKPLFKSVLEQPAVVQKTTEA